MKALIVFKSGAQVEFDVTELSTGRHPLTNELNHLRWVTPDNYGRMLQTVTLSEIAAVVIIADPDDDDAGPMVPAETTTEEPSQEAPAAAPSLPTGAQDSQAASSVTDASIRSSEGVSGGDGNAPGSVG